MSTSEIRVVIVDDHDMVRRGLAILLEAFDDLKLVGQGANGHDAVVLCNQLQPDVLLIDLILPELNGVEAIRLIQQTCPNIRVVVLTNYKEEDLVYQALQAGALGYVMKNVSIDKLATAVRNAYIGKPTLAPEAAEVLVHAVTRPPTPGQDLTEREREVLRLLTQGFNNRRIAETLVISQSTVKNHISNIFSKLGVSNRAEAVALAVQHNLVN